MMTLRRRVVSVCVNESRVDVGLDLSSVNGGMGKKENWRGVVGAERRRVRVKSGIGGTSHLCRRGVTGIRGRRR